MVYVFLRVQPIPLDWFENQIKQQTVRGGPDTYSLSGAGIAVEGIGHIRSGQLLRLPQNRERIDEALGDLRSRGEETVERTAGEGQADRIRRRIGSLAVELEELQRLAASGVRLSESGTSAEALVPALSEVDQKILSLASRQIAGFLFQPLIREILDNPEGGGGFDRVLATSRDLYRNLEASASYHRRLLEKCLQRL